MLIGASLLAFVLLHIWHYGFIWEIPKFTVTLLAFAVFFLIGGLYGFIEHYKREAAWQTQRRQELEFLLKEKRS